MKLLRACVVMLLCALTVLPGSTETYPAGGLSKVLANTTLATPVTSNSDGVVYLASVTGVAADTYLYVDSELMLVTSVNASNKSVAVTRGFALTTAALHVSGAAVRVQSTPIIADTSSAGGAVTSVNGLTGAVTAVTSVTAGAGLAASPNPIVNTGTIGIDPTADVVVGSLTTTGTGPDLFVANADPGSPLNGNFWYTAGGLFKYYDGSATQTLLTSTSPAALAQFVTYGATNAPTNYEALTAGSGITLTGNAGAHTMTVSAPGCNVVASKTTHVSSAEILAANVSPVTLVPAPGVGKSLMEISASASYTFGTAAYHIGGGGANPAFQFYLGNPSDGVLLAGDIEPFFVGLTGSAFTPLAVAADIDGFPLTTSPPSVNRALVMREDVSTGGPLTVGDGALDITTYYTVLDTSTGLTSCADGSGTFDPGPLTATAPVLYNGTSHVISFAGSDVNASGNVVNGSHITNASLPNSGLVNASTTVNSQTCTLGGSCTIPPIIAANSAATFVLANDTITGTTANKLVCLTGADKGIVCPAGTVNGVVGVCTAGCGTAGNATIAFFGNATCVSDNAVTANHDLVPSASVAGDCSDFGATTATGIESVGFSQVTAVAGSNATFTAVDLSALNNSGSKITLQVNGTTTKATANLNGTTPAAPANNTNVTFQVSNSGNTTSVSGYVPSVTTVNGTACTLGSTCTVSTASDPSTTLSISDEFMGHTSSDISGTDIAQGEVGALGWSRNNFGGAVASGPQYGNTVPANHPGIYTLTAQAAGSVLYLELSQNASSVNIFDRLDNKTFDATWIVDNFTFAGGSIIRAGMTGTSGAQQPSDGIYFEVTDAGNWKCVTRHSSVETSTDSGVAKTANTWYTLRITNDGAGNVKFYVNGVLTATNTTNLPVGTQAPFFEIAGDGNLAGNNVLYIDYFGMTMTLAR